MSLFPEPYIDKPKKTVQGNYQLGDTLREEVDALASIVHDCTKDALVQAALLYFFSLHPITQNEAIEWAGRVIGREPFKTPRPTVSYRRTLDEYLAWMEWQGRLLDAYEASRSMARERQRAL